MTLAIAVVLFSMLGTANAAAGNLGNPSSSSAAPSPPVRSYDFDDELIQGSLEHPDGIID